MAAPPGSRLGFGIAATRSVAIIGYLLIGTDNTRASRSKLSRRSWRKRLRDNQFLHPVPVRIEHRRVDDHGCAGIITDR